MRYNSTERRGVNAVEAAFIDELDWIFREQNIDVGIDAFVEKSDKGIPAGKFMAVQVKSGEGNFKVKPDRLTYYVSNIHYNYWTSLNIPIVLVGYIPADGKCYWQEIAEKNLIKTKTRWKIDLPKNNVINRKAKVRFEAILADIHTEDIASELYRVEVGDTSEGIDLLLQSKVCSVNINRMITEFGATFKVSKAKNDHLISQGHGLKSPQLNNALKKQSQGIAVQSKRLEIEASLFSEVFPSEIFELQRYLYSWLKNTGNIPETLYREVRLMPVQLESALSGIEKYHSDTIELRNKIPQLKKAISTLSVSLKHLGNEYREALELVHNVINSLDEEQPNKKL